MEVVALDVLNAPRPGDKRPAATAVRQTASLSWPAAMTPLKSLPPLLLLAGLAAGRKFFPGECPQPPVMRNLSVAEYTRHPWYEQKRYLAGGGTLSAKCQSYTFSDSGNGTIAFVQRPMDVKTKKYYDVKGTLKRFGESEEDQTLASFFMSINGNPLNPSEIRLNYNVLHADNDCNIVWDCINYPIANKSFQLLWIMTRTRSPGETVMSRCYQSLRSVLKGYDENSLRQIDQQDCIIKPDLS